jgi:glycerophosphoryl diester phosphodiesterase
VLILGHRGASVAAPENTPDAFALADSMGADGVELDVRVAPDGRLLVAHDPLPDDPAALDRFCSLDDALDACGDRLLVNVEIKNWPGDAGYDATMALVAPILDSLRARGDASRARWLISSFSWDTLVAARVNDPGVALAWLCLELDEVAIERSAQAGHVAVHPWEQRVDAELVERCHAAGLAVNTWTCNDTDRLVGLDALGVDGVCTDVPDVALAALGRVVALSPRWPARRGGARGAPRRGHG